MLVMTVRDLRTAKARQQLWSLAVFYSSPIMLYLFVQARIFIKKNRSPLFTKYAFCSGAYFYPKTGPHFSQNTLFIQARIFIRKTGPHFSEIRYPATAPDVITVTARRFLAKQLSSLHSASGRSLPKAIVEIRPGTTP